MENIGETQNLGVVPFTDLPLGFTMALAMNEPAMQGYAGLTESEKERIILPKKKCKRLWMNWFLEETSAIFSDKYRKRRLGNPAAVNRNNLSGHINRRKSCLQNQFGHFLYGAGAICGNFRRNCGQL